MLIARVIFGIVMAIPALVLWIPAARALLHNDWSSFAMIALVGTALYILVMSVGVGGILTSFNSVVWTKLYKAFLAKEAT